MKRAFFVACLIACLVQAFSLFAAEPGGTRTWYGYFTVKDENGVGISGVSVELIVTAWYGDELNPQYYTCYQTGITGSGGYVPLSCSIPTANASGLESMWAYMTDSRYSILSSQDTYTYTNQAIWPVFNVVYDLDRNGVKDSWEMPLAQKFCPTLKLHHASEWIAPEPVEYIGVTKQNLWFALYNNLGQYVNDYPIQNQIFFSPPISNYYGWVSSSISNFSFVSGNGYTYTGDPPGTSAYGQYYLRFHFNYVGASGDINSPGQWLSQYQSERQQNLFPHTIYAHLFRTSSETVVQYWIFYPYNDGYNNHEGDWEHINVRLNGQNPATASITTIDFYFHNKVKVLTSGYQLENGTHPKVFVGGSCAGINSPLSCEQGNTTGGSYPWTGTWYNVGGSGYDEYVNGSGPSISYSSIGIVVIPNRDKIDYNSYPGMSWLNLPIRWGNIEVSSPWDFLEPLPFIGDVGNNAPLGPAFNSGWNGVGAVGNFANY